MNELIGNSNIPTIGENNPEALARKLVNNIKESTKVKEVVIAESLESHKATLAKIAKAAGDFKRDLKSNGFTDEAASEITKEWFLHLAMPIVGGGR